MFNGGLEGLLDGSNLNLYNDPRANNSSRKCFTRKKEIQLGEGEKKKKESFLSVAFMYVGVFRTYI